MGETKGSLEVRTRIEGNAILAETKSCVEDSDNDSDILLYATGINIRLADALTRMQGLQASGCYLSCFPHKFLEKYMGEKNG